MTTTRNTERHDKISKFKKAAENSEDKEAAVIALDLLEGFLSDVERIANALETLTSNPGAAT